MSIVFGLYTSDPNLLGCELRRVRNEVQLSEDGGGHNAVGIGAYGDDTVLLHRYPSTAMPASVTDLTLTSRSNVLLYHGRSLPVGMSLEDNTQPFRFRHWLFAQAGEMPGYRAFKQRVWEELPDHLKRHVRGETDAEIAFALFLKGLRDVGRTDDRALDPTTVMKILGACARHLERVSREAAPDKPVNLALVATNEDVLVACRVGSTPLYVRELPGRGTCELHPLAPNSPQAEPMLHAHEKCRSVAVATHPLRDAAGWSPLEEGEALAVGERGALLRARI